MGDTDGGEVEVRAQAMRCLLAGRVRRLLGIGLALGAVAMLPGGPARGAVEHTVHVTVIAGETPTDGGFNFNGYARGGMTLTVPVGWKVVIEFENANPLTHSLVVLPYATTQPSVPPDTPAFPGAATNDLVTGLPRGAKVTLSFIASRPGTYELACGVPGHAAAGMWDKLVVSATARKPSIAPAAAAKLIAFAAR